LSDFLRALDEYRAPKRSIFVSYHHGGDRPFYNAFSTLLADIYDFIEDLSDAGIIDSDDAEYVIQHGLFVLAS
jgi:hypothetical protein